MSGLRTAERFRRRRDELSGSGRGSDTSGPSPLGDPMSEIDPRRAWLDRLAWPVRRGLLWHGGRMDCSGSRRRPRLVLGLDDVQTSSPLASAPSS
jgi:hypothetical protein